MKDILARIAELAGDEIAEAIAKEFGGLSHYIRVRAKLPPGAVVCRECVHYKGPAKGFSNMSLCGITDRHTNGWCRRACHDFTQTAFKPCEPKDKPEIFEAIRRDFNGANLHALAAHHGIPFEEAYRAAIGHKS